MGKIYKELAVTHHPACVAQVSDFHLDLVGVQWFQQVHQQISCS